MSNQKISQLADGGALQATDEVLVARSGQNYRVAGSEFGNGGSQTYTSRAAYSGNPVTVPDGLNSETLLTWDSLGSGAALLNLTDPASPSVVTGGIYSVTAVTICDAFLTAGGAFFATLHLDATNEDAVCEMSGGSGTQKVGSNIQAIVSVNNTYYIPAGGVIRVGIFLADGVAARSFHLREAIIQVLPGGP